MPTARRRFASACGYPIAREGGQLEDLEAKQCLFLRNREADANHCCIVARGHGVVIDHCFFHGCKITAVLFQGPARKYNTANSLFAGNQNLYGAGFGPPVNFRPLLATRQELPATSRVVEKVVELELDQSKRNYLHVAAGKSGSEIAAGLLTKA